VQLSSCVQLFAHQVETDAIWFSVLRSLVAAWHAVQSVIKLSSERSAHIPSASLRLGWMTPGVSKGLRATGFVSAHSNDVIQATMH
jgi:hypothetical protein